MELDELHYAILDQLQIDGRLSNAEIGRRIGLTAPAVAERIKRMRAEGVIKGITVNIDFRQLNYSQQALIGVKLQHGYIEPFLKEAYKVEGVTDIIHTTGEFCFFVGITVSTTDQLTRILDEFGKFAETTTFSVLSVPVAHKSIRLASRPGQKHR